MIQYSIFNCDSIHHFVSPTCFMVPPHYALCPVVARAVRMGFFHANLKLEGLRYNAKPYISGLELVRFVMASAISTAGS